MIGGNSLVGMQWQFRQKIETLKIIIIQIIFAILLLWSKDNSLNKIINTILLISIQITPKKNYINFSEIFNQFKLLSKKFKYKLEIKIENSKIWHAIG
jgi:hypothetical protein